MSNNPEYDLTFIEAFEKVIYNGACVRGENFKNGVYLKCSDSGELVTVDAKHFYKATPHPWIDSLKNQKYRELSVMTIKELSK